MSEFEELHMEQLMDGNLSLPKNNFFLAFPMYCLVRNFKIVVFCESLVVELVQKEFESSLSRFGFVVHLLI